MNKLPALFLIGLCLILMSIACTLPAVVSHPATAPALTQTDNPVQTTATAVTQPTSSATPTVSPTPAFDWIVDLVDDEPKAGRFSSMAIAPDSILHVAYFSDAEDKLRYASFDGQEWTYYPMYIENADGFYPSIAVDSQNEPHIAHYVSNLHSLMYQEIIYGYWRQTAFLRMDNVQPIALRLDRQDRPHIIFYADGKLRYASLQENQLLAEIITGAPEEGRTFPLVLLENGSPATAYYTASGLMYTYRDAGKWVKEQVDKGKELGLYPALCLDENQTVHAAYYDVGSSALKHAWRTAGGWQNETVDTAVIFPTEEERPAGKRIDIACPAGGRIHISYRHDGEKVLKYALYNGVGWNFSQVSQDAGIDHDLVLDGNENPHIIFYNTANKSLNYAHTGATLRTQTPEPTLTPSRTLTSTRTRVPTRTPRPTDTRVPSKTPVPTKTRTPTRTATP